MAIVQNNNNISKLFKTTIGVKQGGPLSPKLFSFYVEDLIKELELKRIGENTYGVYTGVVMYADDILLLTTSLEELQKAINTCERYGIKNEIKFNPDKTQFIIFGKKEKENKKKVPKMYGEEIKKFEKIKYLGIYLNRKNNNNDQVETRIKSAFKASISIKKLECENEKLKVKIKTHLYKAFVRPVLTYGLENYVLNKKQIRKLQTTEGTIIKRMLNLNYKSRTTSLLSAIGLEKIELNLKKRKLGFFKRALNNNLTKEIIDGVELNETTKLSKKSIIKEIFEIIECEEKDYLSMAIENEIENTKEKNNSAISNSIRVCLDNIEIPEYKKMLVELTRSY